MTLDHPDKFFRELETVEKEFKSEADCQWKFNATGLIIAIDAGGPLEFSYNGKEVHGKLYVTDKFVSFDETAESKIWFRVASENPPTTKIRLWAWIRRG